MENTLGFHKNVATSTLPAAVKRSLLRYDAMVAAGELRPTHEADAWLRHIYRGVPRFASDLDARWNCCIEEIPA